MNPLPMWDKESTPPEPTEGPGRRLRAARQAKGIGLDKVASQLHLGQHLLEALEQDDYERLPGAVFVRGYIRNYARLLGIDKESLLGACSPGNRRPGGHTPGHQRPSRKSAAITWVSGWSVGFWCWVCWPCWAFGSRAASIGRTAARDNGRSPPRRWIACPWPALVPSRRMYHRTSICQIPHSLQPCQPPHQLRWSSRSRHRPVPRGESGIHRQHLGRGARRQDQGHPHRPNQQRR